MTGNKTKLSTSRILEATQQEQFKSPVVKVATLPNPSTKSVNGNKNTKTVSSNDHEKLSSNA